jgi:pimeloyl-ACP methyl ester carboxylesterase
MPADPSHADVAERSERPGGHVVRTPWRASARLAVLAAVALVIGVPAIPAGAGGNEVPSAAVQAPAVDFYDVPDPLVPGDPGDVIKTEPIDAPGLHGTLFRVMYHSESLRGDDIVVTGTMAVPSAPAPEGGRPVISWAHGTTGIADVCAPSKNPVGRLLLDQGNQLLDAGYVLVSTDYEGMGTPGRHPYIVGESEARGVIDIVRAARNLDEVDASTDWVVWGHSQGGHAALFTGQIAEEWAPELNLLGTVAGAPPSQLKLVFQALQNSPFRHYILMAGVGMEAAYDEADLSETVTPYGLSKIGVVDTGCANDIRDAYADDSIDDLMKADPYTLPTWKRLIDEQEPGVARTDVPILIIHGGNDEQIPVVSSQMLLERMCGFDQVVTRRVYPGLSHAGVIGVSFPSMLEWINARFAGEPAPTDCTADPVPTTAPASTTTTTPKVPGKAPAAKPIAAKAKFTG